LKGSAAQAFRATGPAFAVGWFVLLFLLTIIVAVVTLSASQLQGRLLSLSTGDSPLSVWQIERIRKQWNSQQKVIERHTDGLIALRERSAFISNSSSQLRDQYYLANEAYGRKRDEIISKLSLYEPLEFEGIGGASDFETRIKIEAVWNGVAAKLLPETRSSVDIIYGAYITSIEEKDDKLVQARMADSKAESANGEVAQAEEALSQAEKKTNEIINPGQVLKAPEVIRMYDLMSEFAFMEDFALGTLYKFAVLPSEFLIIILVVAMGVLGSTLQLTYDYYKAGGIPQTSHFLLRPMLGAITALVLFILLRAGVIVITDSTRLGEAAPLSPFFIAFVGIVSGFLSENALETVRSVGQSWFRGLPADAKPRWALDIRQYLSETKTIGDLAAKTGIEVARLERWIDGLAPAPADMQKLISAWLDKEVRMLFSDIPPAQPS
jgi:hypothetical protein